MVSALQAASTACPAGTDPAALPGPRVSGLPGDGVPLQLLHKEAAYHAVAVGAYELHDYVDFTPWLRSTLLPVSAQMVMWMCVATHPVSASCMVPVSPATALKANQKSPHP